MIEIPADLPSELVPLSWLLGVWEGTGVVDYSIGDERISREFGQRVSFSHDGLPFLNYSSHAWLLGEGAEEITPLMSESGFWRLNRPHTAGDAGPGLLPARGAPRTSSTEDVESLRLSEGGFPLQVTLAHPTGTTELYLGRIDGPRVDLATDAVVRAEGAPEYTAATRLYGLVDNHLLWAWDMSAFGQELRSHASARLAKVQ